MKLKDRVRLLRSRGLKSTPAAIWDQQFKAGQWDFLGKFTEVPRNAVVGGYCRLASSNPAILDVGCGTGVLQTWLGSGGYAEYVGVDLSAAAIDQAQARANANTHFAVSAGESYTPDRTFDVIVLTIHQFSRQSQSFGSGRARSISLTAVRRPRVNQESLLLASFLGCRSDLFSLGAGFSAASHIPVETAQ